MHLQDDNPSPFLLCNARVFSRAADRSGVIPGIFKSKLTITTLAGQNTRPAAITQGVALLPFLGGRESSTLVTEWPPLPQQEGSVHACGRTQECLALRRAPTGPLAAPRSQFHHKWIQRYRSFSSLSKHDLLFTSRTAWTTSPWWYELIFDSCKGQITN